MKKEDNTLIIVIGVVLTLFLFGGFGMMGFGGMGGMMGGFYSGFGMSLFGWLFRILGIIALVLFIVWIIKQIQDSGEKKK